MDPEAQLETWIKAYSQRLVRLAYAYVKDRTLAEDLLQNAFIKAYRSMHQLKNVDNPFPWLASIIINECRTQKRKSWREIVTSVFPQQVGSSAEETYLRSDEYREVHNHILSLPETYRTVLVLHYFEELSTDEIAHVLKRKPSTVRVWLTRGRVRLHNSLKRGEIGERRAKDLPSKTIL